MRRYFTLVFLCGAVVLVSPTPVHAAETASLADEDIVVEPALPADAPLLPAADAVYAPAQVVVVANNPTSTAAEVELRAWTDERDLTTRVLTPAPPDDASQAAVILEPNTVTRIVAEVSGLVRSDESRGHIAIEGDIPPSMVDFTTVRPTPPAYVWIPFLGGLIVTAIFMLIRLFTIKNTGDVTLPPMPKWSLGKAGVGMKQLGYYRFPDSDTWAVKAPEASRDGFYLFGNDQQRGFDVYHYAPTAATTASANAAAAGQWLTPAEVSARSAAAPKPAALTEDNAPFCLIRKV